MTTDPREYKNDPFDPRPIEEKEKEWNRDHSDNITPRMLEVEPDEDFGFRMPRIIII